MNKGYHWTQPTLVALIKNTKNVETKWRANHVVLVLIYINKCLVYLSRKNAHDETQGLPTRWNKINEKWNTGETNYLKIN